MNSRNDVAPRGRGDHDVVIVGGGAAGAVLARRLSEDPQRRVLQLEAGESYAPDAYPDSVRRQDIIGGDDVHDWGYTSEPSFIGRSIKVPRGKVLGGSSAINGAVAIRAPRVDHDRWARDHGLEGWSWDDTLAAFRRAERTSAGPEELHGRTGPIPIHQLGFEETSDMQRAFVEAAVAAGYPRVSDFNGREPFGAGPYPMNTRMGSRLNAGMTYLDAPTRSRPNLTIRARAEVDSVILDGNRATGVRLIDGEEVFGGDVILSGGTYGSPAILMRSGIGPAEDLRRLGIAVAADLPVGKRLCDHPVYFSVWAARKEKIGLGIPPVGAILWGRTKQAAPDDLDLHVVAVHYGNPADSPTGAVFMLAIANTRPASVGSFKLRSRDPRVAPVIDLAFLRERRDRDGMVDGVELARALAASAPLAPFVHGEMAPGPAADTRAKIEASLAATLDTYHHPTSTVPMGGDLDPHAVVDAEGRVRGFQNLRVVDASIFPDVPSVATHVTTLVAAEHIAAEITA
jgi:choline dehydrogenase